MLGRMEFSAKSWGKGAVTDLYGMEILRVETDPEGWLGEYRLARAGRWLKRRGVSRVLLPRAFDGEDLAGRFGLRLVDPAPLLRAQADRLAMAGLSRREVDPDRATVSLSGRRVEREMIRTAVQLCTGVRRLVIDVPGGEGLSRYLREEFGVPMLPPGAPAALELCFHSEGRTGRNPALELYGRWPDLDGGRLWSPALREEDQDDPALLCALWEGGKLDVEGLKFT